MAAYLISLYGRTGKPWENEQDPTFWAFSFWAA